MSTPQDHIPSGPTEPHGTPFHGHGQARVTTETHYWNPLGLPAPRHIDYGGGPTHPTPTRKPGTPLRVIK